MTTALFILPLSCVFNWSGLRVDGSGKRESALENLQQGNRTNVWEVIIYENKKERPPKRGQKQKKSSGEHTNYLVDFLSSSTTPTKAKTTRTKQATNKLIKHTVPVFFRPSVEVPYKCFTNISKFLISPLPCPPPEPRSLVLCCRSRAQ